MFIFKLKSVATKPLLDSKMYKGVNPNASVAGSIPKDFKDDFKRDSHLIFKKMNLPLVRELGSGWYSTTYESFFAGQRVCVKITTEQDEAESYLKMKEVLPSLKEDKTFFPRIFTVKQFTTEEIKNLSQDYFVMITELLVPLAPVVHQNLFDPLESSIALKKLSLEDITKFVKSHIDITMKECQKAVDANKDLFFEGFFKLLQNKDFESKQAIRDFATIIMKKSPEKIPEEDFSYLVTHLCMSIADLIREIKNELFPDINTNLPVVEEKQQLFDAIKSVESKFGITVVDLHRDNIMMRPNGQLVFCDLGSYL